MNDPDFYSDPHHDMYTFDDFVMLEKLGSGSYGQVFLAKNKQTQKLFAIKKFKTDEDFPISTSREIGFLKYLQHPNIIGLHQVLLNRFKCYLVLDYMSFSLDIMIMNHNINDELYQRYLYQLLQAVLFCHHRLILHRDIKPQNILVSHCQNVVKLSDFGMARRIPLNFEPMSPKVVTLSYRSPELLFGTDYYTMAIDVWSLGCVFVEMITKRSPFRGERYMDMWFSFFTQLGVPSVEEFKNAADVYYFIDFRTDEMIYDTIGIFRSKVKPSLYDMIMKMLVYNQNKRFSCCQLLRHDFFKDMDKSKVPAIDEETTGFLNNLPFDYEPEKLLVTAEYVRKLCRAENQENIKPK